MRCEPRMRFSSCSGVNCGTLAGSALASTGRRQSTATPASTASQRHPKCQVRPGCTPSRYGNHPGQLEAAARRRLTFTKVDRPGNLAGSDSWEDAGPWQYGIRRHSRLQTHRALVPLLGQSLRSSRYARGLRTCLPPVLLRAPARPPREPADVEFVLVGAG